MRISDSAFNPARRDGNFEVFHVVVFSRFRDVAYCWNSFIMGNPYSCSNFGQFLGDYSSVGSGMSTGPPIGTSLRRNTHFEPTYTFLQLSVRLGVGLRKLVLKKKSQKEKSHNRYMSLMCPLKLASRIGMELLVSVEADDVIN
jgi:hypothetical protein